MYFSASDLVMGTPFRRLAILCFVSLRADARKNIERSGKSEAKNKENHSLGPYRIHGCGGPGLSPFGDKPSGPAVRGDLRPRGQAPGFLAEPPPDRRCQGGAVGCPVLRVGRRRPVQAKPAGG